MARSFAVHYLVFCESVDHRDRSKPHRDWILDGVDYTFKVPPGTEFPFEPNEFWLFARFYWLGRWAGATPPLWISCVWLDSPGGQSVEVWRRNVGSVNFASPRQVADRAWVFRNFPDAAPYRFPGLGRYEFRLWYPVRKLGIRRIKRREYVSVEV